MSSKADGGCRIRVRVQPAARRDRIVGYYGSRLKITVAAPPERGKANDAVAHLIATVVGVPASRVRVVAGFASRDKMVQIDGCLPETVRERIEAALEGESR